MRDYQSNITLRHKLKKRNSTFILFLHVTVTVISSTMSKTQNSKMSVKRALACSWAVVFTSVDKPYIWVSLSL